MPSSKHILIVGGSELVGQFVSLLGRYDISAVKVGEVHHAMKALEKEQVDAIVFILPRYWDDVTRFVQELRTKKAYTDTPVLYVGSLVEGEDQRVLHQYGVKTLTLGPLPPEEVVRYIHDMLK